TAVRIRRPTVGSPYIVGLGQGRDEEIRQQVMEALRASFRPEFLNRIDETIIFHQLSKEQIGEIVQIQLDQVSRRLSDRGIRIQLTPAARDLIATLGYDPAYGARPLKRGSQKQSLEPLAMKLLSGAIREGETVTIEARDHEFTFTGQLSDAEVVA